LGTAFSEIANGEIGRADVCCPSLGSRGRMCLSCMEKGDDRDNTQKGKRPTGKDSQSENSQSGGKMPRERTTKGFQEIKMSHWVG